MKKTLIFMATLIGLLAVLTPLAGAQETSAELEDSLTGSLASAEDVMWYSFEMSEPGDAVLVVTGLQEYWDGYPYHWVCAIYEEDRETVITQDSVRGYSKNNGPSILPAPKLDAGTYFVRMTSVRSGNPLMAGFTTDPYQIQLLRYYPSALAAETSNRVQTFRNAGDVLWAFDGTAFLKLYDGECYGALMESADGAVVPILIGTEENSVAYVISGTGKVVTAGLSWHHEALDADRCYYSDSRSVNRYTDKPVDTSALPMLYIDSKHAGSAKSAAEMIADQLIGMEADDGQSASAATDNGQFSGTAADPGRQNNAEDGGSGSRQKKSGNWSIYLGAGIVVLIILSCIPGKRSSKPSHRASNYPSSGHSTYFSNTTVEVDLFKGGVNGCGIAGSFCGCGSGK